MSNPPPPPPPPGFGGPPPPPNFGAPPLPPSFGMNYNETGGPVLAEWWQRLVARIIDGLILGCLGNFTGLGTFRRSTNSGGSTSFGFNGVGFIGAIVVGLLYYGLMHGLKGQTLGKMALGIKVVQKGTDTKLEMGPAFIRAGVDALLWATCIGGILDGLWPLWDKDRQAIHDKAGNSQVMKAR